MTDTITITGLVATDPRNIVTSEGLAITTFRLASTQRRYDRKEGRWVDGETNWYGITSFRQLAVNVAASIKKGERVIVSGRLKIRSWDNGEKAGTNVDIEADSLGHDLAWGTTAFNRTILVSSVQEPQEQSESGSQAAAEPGPRTDAVPAHHAAGERADDTEAVPVPF